MNKIDKMFFLPHLSLCFAFASSGSRGKKRWYWIEASHNHSKLCAALLSAVVISTAAITRVIN